MLEPDELTEEKQVVGVPFLYLLCTEINASYKSRSGSPILHEGG